MNFDDNRVIEINLLITYFWTMSNMMSIVFPVMQQSSSIPSAPQATSPTEQYPNSGKSGSSWRSALSTIAILLAAPAVALLLTTFVFQSYEVDGPSMETTLQNQDRLIVWKLSRTIARLDNHAYIPHRGDVIIFIKRGLYESGGTKEKQLIKRVIGLPGDRVVVADGKYIVYNKENPNGYNPDINHDFSPGIASYTSGNIDLTVAEGQVFVSGDNRPNSLDSRAFGTIPAQDIVGKLSARIFPISKYKTF